MNFRQIEAFRAVMLTGTTTEAAALLRTTQPAVSRLIRQFEHASRLKLFELHRGRLAPTPEAKALLREVERSYCGLDRVREAIETLRDSGVGRLAVGAVPSLGMSVLPRVIHAFLARYPKAALSLHTSSSNVVRDGVASALFDIGFAAQEIDTTGVKAQPFVTTRAVCVMNREHPLAQKRSLRARDLAGAPLFLLTRGDVTRRRLDEVLAAAEVAVEPAVETTYGATVCALALEGVGVGVVNPLIAGGFASRGLVIKPLEPAVYFEIFLLYPLHAPPSRLAREFEGLVREALHSETHIRIA
ncbi:MAG: LysR family transcriptional regulator [Burkholderiales bacterium]|nr:LysR family transcriptional regulator [Burkholderiales bacterium]